MDRLTKEAKSLRHLMTHLPKNEMCKVCQRAKIAQKQARKKERKKKKKQGDDPEPLKFGDLITADGIVLKSEAD